MFTIITFFCFFITLLYGVFTIVISSDKKLYCKFYCKEDYKSWEKIIENANAFTFECDNRIFNEDYSTSMDLCFVGKIDGTPYRIVKYKNENGVYVFRQDDHKIVLTNFDEYHSVKMQNILLSNLTDKIYKERNEKYLKEIEESR